MCIITRVSFDFQHDIKRAQNIMLFGPIQRATQNETVCHASFHRNREDGRGFLSGFRVPTVDFEVGVKKKKRVVTVFFYFYYI